MSNHLRAALASLIVATGCFATAAPAIVAQDDGCTGLGLDLARRSVETLEAELRELETGMIDAALLPGGPALNQAVSERSLALDRARTCVAFLESRNPARPDAGGDTRRNDAVPTGSVPMGFAFGNATACLLVPANGGPFSGATDEGITVTGNYAGGPSGDVFGGMATTVTQTVAGTEDGRPIDVTVTAAFTANWRGALSLGGGGSGPLNTAATITGTHGYPTQELQEEGTWSAQPVSSC